MSDASRFAPRTLRGALVGGTAGFLVPSPPASCFLSGALPSSVAGGGGPLLPLPVGGGVPADDDGSESSGEPTGVAQIRFVHAATDAPNVDVVVDGATVLSNVPFGAASDYLPVDAGNRQLQVRPAGSSTAVIDANQDLEDGSDYTVIASGLVANISALALRDDNAVPAAGQIRLRVVHGAPSAPAVDVYVTAPGADLNAATPTQRLRGSRIE